MCARAPNLRRIAGLDTRASEVLYARAVGLMPGGVNSPVRAMRSIGRDYPIFVERGEGFELIDVDGNRYVDWVCSWGPLILGHAASGRGRRRQRCGRARDQLRGADRGRGRARRRDLRPLRVGRDGADGQLGHRGDDERRAPRPGGDRPREAAQVRRRLPRPRRRPAGRGRLRPRDAGHPGQPRRPRGAGGGDDRRAVERPGRGRGGPDRARDRRGPRRAAAGEHGPGPARARASSPSCAGSPTSTARCSSSTR